VPVDVIHLHAEFEQLNSEALPGKQNELGQIIEQAEVWLNANTLYRCYLLYGEAQPIS